MTNHAATVSHTTSVRQQTVLVVENDALVGDVIRYLVDTAGANTRTYGASCLRDACGMLATIRFDLLIVDLGLPDSSGLTTATALRRRTDAEIVLYSASLNDGHVMSDARRAGFEHCLPKGSTSRADVRRCIGNLL